MRYLNFSFELLKANFSFFFNFQLFVVSVESSDKNVNLLWDAFKMFEKHTKCSRFIKKFEMHTKFIWMQAYLLVTALPTCYCLRPSSIGFVRSGQIDAFGNIYQSYRINIDVFREIIDGNRLCQERQDDFVGLKRKHLSAHFCC